MDLFATTAEGKPAVGGEFIFTGVTIYYLYYAEVSIRENVNQEGKKSGNSGVGRYGKEADAKKSYTRREEKSGSHELLKPRTWPDWSNENDKKKGVEIGTLDI